MSTKNKKKTKYIYLFEEKFFQQKHSVGRDLGYFKTIDFLCLNCDTTFKL